MSRWRRQLKRRHNRWLDQPVEVCGLPTTRRRYRQLMDAAPRLPGGRLIDMQPVLWQIADEMPPLRPFKLTGVLQALLPLPPAPTTKE